MTAAAGRSLVPVGRLPSHGLRNQRLTKPNGGRGCRSWLKRVVQEKWKGGRVCCREGRSRSDAVDLDWSRLEYVQQNWNSVGELCWEEVSG